jgi:hypothetical protein
MKIDDDVRVPLEHRGDPPPRLGLGLREPVAVHVEQVMVRPPAGPPLVVLGGNRIGIGRCRGAQQVVGDETGTAVRVLHRIDHDDRVATHQIDIAVALRRQQVIRHGERGVRRGDLVAMDAVHQPGHHREPLRQPVGVAAGQAARIREPPQVRFHLIERGDSLGRRDHEEPQRAALPRPGVLRQPRTIRRRLVQRPQVDRDLFRRGDLLTVIVSENLRDRRDPRIVDRTWRKFWRRGGRDLQGEEPCREHRRHLTSIDR